MEGKSFVQSVRSSMQLIREHKPKTLTRPNLYSTSFKHFKKHRYPTGKRTVFLKEHSEQKLSNATSLHSLSPRFNSPSIASQIKLFETIGFLDHKNPYPGLSSVEGALRVLQIIADDTKGYKHELQLAMHELQNASLISSDSLPKDVSDYIYEDHPGTYYSELICRPKIPFCCLYKSLLRCFELFRSELEATEVSLLECQSMLVSQTELGKELGVLKELLIKKEEKVEKADGFNAKLIKKAVGLEEEVRDKQLKLLKTQLDFQVTSGFDKDRIISEQKRTVKRLMENVKDLEGESLISGQSMKNAMNVLDGSAAELAKLERKVKKQSDTIEKNKEVIKDLELTIQAHKDLFVEDVKETGSRGDLTPRPNMSNAEYLFGNTKGLSTKQKVSHLLFLLKKRTIN